MIIDDFYEKRGAESILIKIMFLLFANSTNGSGIYRPQIRIRRGRKYPQLTGIKVFFDPMCASHFARIVKIMYSQQRIAGLV